MSSLSRQEAKKLTLLRKEQREQKYGEINGESLTENKGALQRNRKIKDFAQPKDA